ncbi:MAG: hypothetical protein EPO07_09270 [Verrucomicrobia bacterium]|nr:MAG: hypothetical protein EPO07_09270 [Verrucomicrobiota bacterium]
MPPQPDQSPSFMQQYIIVKWLIQFPARSVMVLLRRDIGVRLLNPLVLAAVFGFVAVLAILATPGNEAARPGDLLIFAGLGFLSGIVQRVRRLWGMSRNVRQHTYYIGSSPFAKWLPEFLRRNRRDGRFIDPLFCMTVGFILLPYSKALAMWLVFSGFCLRLFEFTVHEREQENELDLKDSLVEAEQNSRTVEQSEHVPDEMPEQSDAGIPTGIGSDISEQVKKQRTRKAKRP